MSEIRGELQQLTDAAVVLAARRCIDRAIGRVGADPFGDGAAVELWRALHPPAPVWAALARLRGATPPGRGSSQEPDAETTAGVEATGGRG